MVRPSRCCLFWHTQPPRPRRGDSLHRERRAEKTIPVRQTGQLVTSWLPPRSIMTVDVLVDHLFPPGPVVRPAIPDAQSVPDFFAPQDARHLLITAARGIVAPNRHNDIHTPQCRYARLVMLVGDEGAGIVEIDIVVREALGKTCDVIQAAQSNNTINQLWIAEGEIHRMIRAKARASRHQKGVIVALSAERHHFVQEIAIVLDVPLRARSRVLLFGVPAFAIHAIYAIQLDMALFQALTQRFNHTRIFPLEETPHRCREHEYSGPGMTENQQLHVTIKRTTIPTMIFTIHFTTHSHLASHTQASYNAGQQRSRIPDSATPVIGEMV